MTSRRKPKLNPSGLCICCGVKIFNRNTTSLYCTDCRIVKDRVKEKIYNAVNFTKRNYPDFKLSISFDLNKKKKQHK